jgi:hypothetical protein
MAVLGIVARLCPPHHPNVVTPKQNAVAPDPATRRPHQQIFLRLLHQRVPRTDLEHHSEAGEVDVVTHNLGVTTPKLEMAIRQKYSPPIAANDPAKEPGP